MGWDAHKNLAYSTVATAPSPASSGTSLVVAAGDGAKFPAVPFNATIWPINTQPTTANAEIVTVTARSTDTLTITRAQESTSARTVVIGDQIAATITAKSLTDIESQSTAGITYKMLPNDAPIGTAGSASMAANAVRFWRFFLHRKIVVTSVTFRLTTAGGAGKLVSVGIYNSDGTSLLVDSTPITAVGTGVKTKTGLSVTLFPGEYIMAWTTDSAAAAAFTTVPSSTNQNQVFNDVVVIVGTAGNSSTAGQLPATLGTLTTSADVDVPIVKLQA